MPGLIGVFAVNFLADSVLGSYAFMPFVSGVVSASASCSLRVRNVVDRALGRWAGLGRAGVLLRLLGSGMGVCRTAGFSWEAVSWLDLTEGVEPFKRGGEEGTWMTAGGSWDFGGCAGVGVGSSRVASGS